MPEIFLSSDGSLDTVLCCSGCCKEFRYNYVSYFEGWIGTGDEDDIPTYDEWLDEQITNTTEHHDCNDEENDFL